MFNETMRACIGTASSLLIIVTAMLSAVPSSAQQRLYRCEASSGGAVFQDTPCQTIQSRELKEAREAQERRAEEAKAQASEAERRRERSRQWDERMRQQHEELAKKPIPKEVWNIINTVKAERRPLGDSELESLLPYYATVIGRASACGVDASQLGAAVGRQIDRVVPPGSSKQKQYLLVMTEGSKIAAKQQMNGTSPDSCTTVSDQFRKVPVP